MHIKLGLILWWIFFALLNSYDGASLAIELASTRKGTPQQLVEHPGYTVSFNPAWLIPNWVAWDLTPEKAAGSIARPQRQFEPDPLVHGKQATHWDYSNSGFCRGHMAPAGDMKWSEYAMNESFYTSNICPQDMSLNNGRWKSLEEHTRMLAREGQVFICCGPIMSDTPEYIGDNQVAVPEGFFKVMCMKRKGRWQAIGFLFKNEKCPGGLAKYATTVDEIEKLTGHDFFYLLPDRIETDIEAHFSWKQWQ